MHLSRTPVRYASAPPDLDEDRAAVLALLGLEVDGTVG
jgi:crotonobetainyl-CoA:carnitine CoA-transferase CaiB-like acyl-CoA transferase